MEHPARTTQSSGKIAFIAHARNAFCASVPWESPIPFPQLYPLSPHQNATHSTHIAAQRVAPRPGSSRKRSSFLRVVTFGQTRPTERCPATRDPSKQSIAIQLHQIILRERSRLSNFDFNYRLVKATTSIGRFLLSSVAQMKHRE